MMPTPDNSLMEDVVKNFIQHRGLFNTNFITLNAGTDNDISRKEFVYYINAANKGVVDHYPFVNPDNVFLHYFFLRNDPEVIWSPFLFKVDLSSFQTTFGKIKREEDLIDLEKSGIKPNKTDNIFKEFEQLLSFVCRWISKTKDPILNKKLLFKASKTGIVFSIPEFLEENLQGTPESIFMEKHAKLFPLNIPFEDYLCPRCEHYFKIINPSQDFSIVCPKCNQRFHKDSARKF